MLPNGNNNYFTKETRHKQKFGEKSMETTLIYLKR